MVIADVHVLRTLTLAPKLQISIFIINKSSFDFTENMPQVVYVLGDELQICLTNEIVLQVLYYLTRLREMSVLINTKSCM